MSSDKEQRTHFHALLQKASMPDDEACEAPRNFRRRHIIAAAVVGAVIGATPVAAVAIDAAMLSARAALWCPIKQATRELAQAVTRR